MSVLSLAVMTLRHFEREAAKKQSQIKETQHLQSEHTKRHVQYKQLKETERDKNLLLVALFKAKVSH